MSNAPKFVTRFAPSPTGFLHLGHVLHMMWTWGAAQISKAYVHIRLEDHDRSRCRLEFGAAILDDLIWLGFLPPGSTTNIWQQSQRGTHYTTASDTLIAKNLVYACTCSRKEVMAQNGQDSGELFYQGNCRDKMIPLDSDGAAWRVRMPDQEFQFTDLRHGPLTQNPARQCGDVVIRDRLKSWTYQFCVVVDDLEQGVNLITRGDDLLNSVGRQLAMRKLLNSHSHEPHFLHHPLLADPVGHKLSKRKFSESIAELRRRGLSANDVFQSAASLSGEVSGRSWDVGKCREIIPHEIQSNLKSISKGGR